MLNREKAERILLDSFENVQKEHLTFIRMGENAVFQDAKNNYILRVYRDYREHDYVAREIEIVKKLAEAGISVPVISDEYDDVVYHDGHLISVWKEIPHKKESKINLFDFGELLKSIHEQMQGMQLQHQPPIWNPLKATETRFKRVKEHGLISDREESSLSKLLAKVEVEYKKIIVNSKNLQLIHGDSHIGNLLVEESSEQLFMLDFENNSMGIFQWDLIPTLIAHERFGLSENQLNSFVKGYGFDLRESELYKPLKLIRELSMTVWLFQKRGESLEIDNQINIRLESLLKGKNDVNWGAF